MDDAWEGTVLKKSRGLLDGSNMYRRLRLRLADGTERKVKVGKELWKTVHVGDTVAKAAGQDPVKK